MTLKKSTIEYPFIIIALRFTLTRNGNAWYGPLYESDRTVWHLNSVQTKGLFFIELFEIESFAYLTEC